MTMIIRLDFQRPVENVDDMKRRAECVLQEAFPNVTVRARTWDEMIGTLTGPSTEPSLDGPLDNDEIDDDE